MWCLVHNTCVCPLFSQHVPHQHRRLRLEQLARQRAQATVEDLQHALAKAHDAHTHAQQHHATQTKAYNALKARAAATKRALHECQAQLETCRVQASQRAQQLKAAKVEHARLSRALADARGAAEQQHQHAPQHQGACAKCAQLQQRLQAALHAGRARAAEVQRLGAEVEGAEAARGVLQQRVEVLQGQLTRCKAMCRGKEATVEALQGRVDTINRYGVGGACTRPVDAPRVLLCTTAHAICTYCSALQEQQRAGKALQQELDRAQGNAGQLHKALEAAVCAFLRVWESSICAVCVWQVVHTLNHPQHGQQRAIQEQGIQIIQQLCMSLNNCAWQLRAAPAASESPARIAALLHWQVCMLVCVHCATMQQHVVATTHLRRRMCTAFCSLHHIQQVCCTRWRHCAVHLKGCCTLCSC